MARDRPDACAGAKLVGMLAPPVARSGGLAASLSSEFSLTAFEFGLPCRAGLGLTGPELGPPSFEAGPRDASL